MQASSSPPRPRIEKTVGVYPNRKVVAQPPEPVATPSACRKLGLVRNQETHWRINMNRLIGWVGRSTLGLATILTLAACSTLPPTIPEAIGLAGDRIELNAVAAHTALDNLITNAAISRKQIEAARNYLKQIEGTLSEEDGERIRDSLRLLDDTESSLQPSDEVIMVRDQIRSRLESTSSALKQIQGILAESVEQEQIADNLVRRLQDAVSNENEGDHSQ